MGRTWTFVASRLAQAALVMAIVSFASFLLFQFIGDPVENMLGQEATPEEKQALRGELGLDRSIIVQFLAFAARALRGNLGVSYRQGRPVLDLLMERAPATFELVATSAVLAIVLGVTLGVYIALRPDTRAAAAIQSVALLATSLPSFVTGTLLIYGLAVWARALPAFGRGDTVAIGGWTTGFLTRSGLESLVLPSVTLAFFQFALILRLTRAETRDVLREDYIKFARARGLPPRALLFNHVLRNALLPLITVIGAQVGNLLAYSVITETVFQWPGLSKLFIDAVQFADIPVLGAYFIMVAAVFVTINLVVDLLSVALDPRLRDGAGGRERLAAPA